MIFKNFTFFFLISIILSSGCRKEIFRSLQNDKVNKTLVMSLGGDATYLNPLLYTDVPSASVTGMIFNGLVKVNSDLEVVPDLARSWTASEDGKVWTFNLRKNAFWHDGKAFSAEDVKFTFDKLLEPTTNTVRRSDYIIDGLPLKLEIIDPYKIKAILPKPFAPFLLNMSMGIIPKHIFENEDINRSRFNREPIGTGPFKFKKWQTADHIILEKNPHYFLGPPKLDQIIFRIIPNENSRLVALELGEIDETNIPPYEVERIKNIPHINFFSYDVLSYTYIGFNLTNPLFKKKEIRQALNLAINKKILVKSVFKDFARPASIPQSPTSWAYPKNIIFASSDPQKAEKLLQTEGWQKNKNGFLEKNGSIFRFTLITNQGNKEREKTATIIQEHLRKIGVQMDIQIMEWSSLLKIINNLEVPRKFDATLIGWMLGLDPDDYNIWHSSQYPRGFNYLGYKNPQVDRLLELGRITLEQNKRKEIYAKIYKLIAEDQPYIFLWYPKTIAGVNKRVYGLSKPGPAGLFVDIEKVDVKKINE